MTGQAIVTEEQVTQFQVQKSSVWSYVTPTPPQICKTIMLVYHSDVRHALQEDGAILLRGVFSSQWVDVVKKGNLWKKSVNI